MCEMAAAHAPYESYSGKYGFFRNALRLAQRGNIEDGDGEATITCAFTAIGRDAHEMPNTPTCLDGLHHRLATFRDARQILSDRRNQRMREPREQPAEIVLLEWDLKRRLSRHSFSEGKLSQRATTRPASQAREWCSLNSNSVTEMMLRYR
jgi:hypothetical protein